MLKMKKTYIMHKRRNCRIIKLALAINRNARCILVIMNIPCKLITIPIDNISENYRASFLFAAV